jgi:uncharacterized protein (DUF4415 family)
MRNRTVSYTAESAPRPTRERLAELARLEAMPEERIDTEDMPELTAAQLADMERGRFYRPVKQQVTARLDADVLAWLKAGGQGYQSRMNAILRRAMLADREG